MAISLSEVEIYAEQAVDGTNNAQIIALPTPVRYNGRVVFFMGDGGGAARMIPQTVFAM